MICTHCEAPLSTTMSFSRPIEGGAAYAATCANCGHIVELRPRNDSDPRPGPPDLNDAEVARMRFVQWRLREECLAQLGNREAEIAA